MVAVIVSHNRFDVIFDSLDSLIHWFAGRLLGRWSWTLGYHYHQLIMEFRETFNNNRVKKDLKLLINHLPCSDKVSLGFKILPAQIIFILQSGSSSSLEIASIRTLPKSSSLQNTFLLFCGGVWLLQTFNAKHAWPVSSKFFFADSFFRALLCKSNKAVRQLSSGIFNDSE